jgi:thioredoxin 1
MNTNKKNGLNMEETQISIEDIQTSIKDKKALILYFYNNHCAPCLALRSKVEKMAKEKFPQISLQYINATNHSCITTHFQIYSSPVILVCFEGKECIRMNKYVSIEDLACRIERYYDLMTG